MWQLLILFYFILGSGSYLLRRVLAQRFDKDNRLVNAVFFVFFLLPAIIILSFFFPHNLNVGLLNLILLLGGSVIWPLFNLAAFRANREVDVGIFTIISNLSPLFTLVVAIPFLHEHLSGMQYLGIAFLILSGVLAVSTQYDKRARFKLNGVLMCLLSAAILGFAIAYESFMLARVDFGAYLIYGWGAQVAWMAIITGKELKKLPGLFKDKKTKIVLLLWGATSVFKSISFILALKISKSASLISAATDFLSVVVVITAYLFLKEKEHMLYKWLGAGIGIIGLILIAK